MGKPEEPTSVHRPGEIGWRKASGLSHSSSSCKCGTTPDTKGETSAENHAMYRTLLESTSHIIILIDTEGRCVWTNQAGIEFFGEDIINQHYSEFVQVQEAAATIEEFALPFPTREETRKTKTLLKKRDGTPRLLQWHLKPLKYKGQFIGGLAVAHDITGKQEVEMRGFAPTTLLERILNGLPEAVMVQKPDQTVLWLNQAGYQLFGLTPAQVAGKKCYELLGQERECEPCLAQKALVSKKIEVLEKYVPVLDMYLECRSNPILDDEGEIKLVVAQLCDVTRYKQLENQIKIQATEYETIFNSTHDALFLMDVDSDQQFRFRRLNSSHERLTGLSTAAVRGLTPQEALGEELGRQFEANFRRCLDAETPISYEETLELPAGRRTWHTTLVPVKAGERVVQIVGLSRDITRQEQTEAALRESEAQYRRLVELSPDGILVICDEKIVFANTAAVKLLGATCSKELMGRPWPLFSHPDSWQTARERDRQVLQERKVLPLMEEKLIRLDGSTIAVETAKNPFTFQGKPALQVVLRDITARKKLEEELFRISKLESLGLLAGGIAHDFNNLLTIMLGNISLAKLYVSENGEVQQKLKEIEKAALQARELTQQLLTFARGRVPVKKTVSLGKLLKDATTLALSGSHVRYQFSIPGDLAPVEIDEGQISQVIHNLIINAAQAMPTGGTVYVKAENITLAEGTQEGVPLAAGRYVKISITDEGIGIPPEYHLKIFDPYFTTKKNGTGLGLAIAYSIIKKHNGHITVDSEVGTGTTFTIYLPTSAATSPPSKEEDDRLFVSNGKILVMDDEETVRDVTGEMLAVLGYETEFATDGASAFKKYKQAKEAGKPFAAVIIDLTIPGGMGGREVIKKLLALDPNVKAILSSGYTNDPVMVNFKEYGFARIIRKPYDIKDLSKVLHEVLNPPPESSSSG